MTAIGDYFREQAASHRTMARQSADDPRYPRSADALENLADYADRAADEGLFQMRYLTDHHVEDGRFLWADGQSGRTIARYGFDQPIHDPMERETFLMDLCSLAKIDASRHIGTVENGFDRADAEEIGQRYGISTADVHRALDTGRGYFHLFAVGIPHWHTLDDDARGRLEAMDGVRITRGRKEQFPDEPEPPLVACNIVADDEEEARAIVAQAVGIDAGALGVTRTERLHA